MNAFTIKDLENLSGIKAHTIRIWEQRYAFLKPQRTGTNIRYYSTEELKKLLNIALLNRYGYKISHIDKMSNTEIKEKILTLTQTEAQQERVVNDLLRSMVDLDMEAFEQILDNYIKTKDIDKAVMQVMFPFLEKIGILWITNHINPAQEHLVSNILRQKLITGIERVHSYIQVNKTALLFLPEGEHHELGLLFAHYILKSRGFGVLYMGSDTPLEDLAYVINRKNIDLVYTHLISFPSNFNFDKFLCNLGDLTQHIPVVVSGHPGLPRKTANKGNIHFKYSLHEVTEFISAL